MPHAVTIECSLAPGLAELLAALDAAAWANARWYLAERRAGRKPPCCLDCSELRYVPDAPARDIRIRTGAVLLRIGVASCDELACLEAGRVRADAMLAGEPWEEAESAARVELEERTRRPNGRGGQAVLWHAFVLLRSGARVDPAAMHLQAATRGKVGARVG